MKSAIELSRKEAIAAAEKKLSRSLTTDELAGVQRIESLLKLESCCRAFKSQAYSTAEVLADLERFAREPSQD